jgi:hypothetical protein
MMNTAIARLAVTICLPMIRRAMDHGIFKRNQMHLVIGTRHQRPGPDDPTPKHQYPEMLWEEAIRDDTYEGPFDEIARAKAGLTWRTGLPTRTLVESYPHLLKPGDIRFWGSWIEADIIAAASGASSAHDEWVSKLLVSTAIVLCQGNHQHICEQLSKKDLFLPKTD